MLIQHIIYGVLLIIVGTLMIKYTFGLVGWVGHPDWIERYLGSGSIYLVIKLLGVLVVLSGILYAAGLWDSVIGWALSPLARLLNPGSQTY